MILSVIESLKRSIMILDDIPKQIITEKEKLIPTLNDIFEDYRDQFDGENKEVLKKLTKLKLDLMNKIDESFVNLSGSIAKDVSIVEE